MSILELNVFEKIIYLHAPKTGGTSITNYISEYFDQNDIVSALHSNQKWILEGTISENIRFIAGHISFSELNEKINMSDFLVLACLRNPLEQIISHLAHFRRLYEEKNRDLFLTCSDEHKQIILRLAGTDFNDPKRLSSYIETLNNEELLLFDNIQVRMYTSNFSLAPNGQKIGFKELEYALDNLYKIDLVGELHNIQNLFSVVNKRMGWQAIGDIPFDNVNTEKHGLDIKNPAIVNALWPLIRYDMALYSQRAHFLCASNNPYN
jgi:hypothetical protein